MELGHVERHVDETDGALPGQVNVLRRQRHRGVADGGRDPDGIAEVVDRFPADGRHDARCDLVELVGAGRRHEDQELLAAPAHDHVRFAQRVAEALRDDHQDRVAGRMAISVVGLLEEIDVDQEQRVDRLLRLAAAPALGLRGCVAHEVLEIAPVVERGERIAAAAHAQFAVLLREEAVVDAQSPVVDAGDDERGREHRGEQPPHAFAQGLVLELRRVERILPIEQLDFAPPLVRLVFLLQFEHRPLVRRPCHFLVELAFAVEERERRPVIPGLLEILAVLAEERRDFRRRAGAFVFRERLVRVTLAFARPAEAEEREPDVRLAGGDVADVVVFGRQRERPARQRQGVAEILAPKPDVREVDEREALAHLRFRLAGEGERIFHRRKLARRFAENLERRGFGHARLHHRRRAARGVAHLVGGQARVQRALRLLQLQIEVGELVERVGPAIGVVVAFGERAARPAARRAPPRAGPGSSP